MRIVSVLTVCGLCIALYPGQTISGVQGRVLSGRVHTAVGYLPRHLAAEKEPTPLSLDVLDPSSTHDEAVAKANVLHAALKEDRTKTLNNLFVSWAEAHEEYYASEEEALEAFERLAHNVEHMVHHNLKADQHGHWRGLNKWSGRNLFAVNRKFVIAGKCKNLTIGSKLICPSYGAQPPTFTPGATAPKEIDWRKKGFTTPVKQQGSSCNSAWANAAASAVDAGVSIQLNTTPISISRQALLSCIDPSVSITAGRTYNSYGCSMGRSDDVFNFLNNNTVPPETKWGYTSGNGNVGACIKNYLKLNKANPDSIPWVQDSCAPMNCGVAGAIHFLKTPGPTNALYLAGGNVSLHPDGPGGVYNGVFYGRPVVTYWSFLNKSDPLGTGPCKGYDCDFLNYQGGIYKGTFCPAVTGASTDLGYLNHAMMIVGYNTTDPDNSYWILQNSFGSSWGEQGLIRVTFNTSRTGTCGMYAAMMAPTLNFTGGLLPKKPSRFLKGSTTSYAVYCSDKYGTASQVRFCRGDPLCYDASNAINNCPEL